MSTPKSSAFETSAYLLESDLSLWLPAIESAPFGVTALNKPLSMKFYDQWIEDGFHGDMSYLARHRTAKAEPETWLPKAKSAIVFLINYVTPETSSKSEKQFLPSLRTALYTRWVGNRKDYHTVIRERLAPVVQELEKKYPNATFRLAVDAEPVLERDLAVRAGHGWVGKNTCVLNRQHGSLFFIAEILTSLEVPPERSSEAAAKARLSETARDFCGTCTKCIDSCPTGALIEPRKLDARKCISYWTIEAKTTAGTELSKKFGDWFFGCDICQTVCPWNEKVYGKERMAKELKATESREALVEDLRWILESSNRELERSLSATPLSRARGFGLKRNALVIAQNLKLHELEASIAALTANESLADLAQSVLESLVAQTFRIEK